MVSRDTKADLPVDFEAARGREEAEARRAQRVGWREDNAAVIYPAGVGRGWWRTGEGEVPVEEVVVKCWCGVEVRGGGGGELGGFFH